MEFTTTMTVPFCDTAFSTSAAVRASSIPAEVSSCRMGATIISGYIEFLLRRFYQDWIETRKAKWISGFRIARIAGIAKSAKIWRITCAASCNLNYGNFGSYGNLGNLGT